MLPTTVVQKNFNNSRSFSNYFLILSLPEIKGSMLNVDLIFVI